MVLALQITAGHVIEEQTGAAVGVQMLEEPLLHDRLVFRQPRQIRIELIFVERAQPEHVAGRMGTRQPHRAEPGPLIDGPGQHLPQGQLAGAIRPQGPDNPQALGHLAQRPDRAKGKALAQVERPLAGLGERLQIFFMFERQFDSIDFLGGAGGEIGDGAVFDLAVVAVGLAQQDTGVGPAADGDFRLIEIHSVHIKPILKPIYKH